MTSENRLFYTAMAVMVGLFLIFMCAPVGAQPTSKIPGTNVDVETPSTGGSKETIQEIVDDGRLGQGTLVSTAAELTACFESGDYFTRCALAAGTEIDVGAGLTLDVVPHTTSRNGGTRSITCAEGAGFRTADTTPGLEILVVDNPGTGIDHDMQILVDGCQSNAATGSGFNQIGMVFRGGHPGRLYLRNLSIGDSGLGGSGAGNAIWFDEATYSQIKAINVPGGSDKRVDGACGEDYPQRSSDVEWRKAFQRRERRRVLQYGYEQPAHVDRRPGNGLHLLPALQRRDQLRQRPYEHREQVLRHVPS